MQARVIARAMLCVVAGLQVLVASAEPTFLTSVGNRIYRFSQAGDTETFDFDQSFHAFHRDSSTGEVYALGIESGATSQTLHKVENALTGPLALVPYSQLSGQYGSLTRIGTMFYGIDGNALWSIDVSDPLNPVETNIGATGVLYDGGLAYDTTSATLYMITYDTDSLYTLDPSTGTATLVGDLGINFGSCGAEWFEGQLYTGLRNYTSQNFEVGTIDTGSGAYSLVRSLGDLNGITGITVIPEPTAIVLLLIAGIAVVRHRG